MTDLETTITCPECGHKATEKMPTNACQYFYDCKGCGTVLKPRRGDCCVYCSYADKKMPAGADRRGMLSGLTGRSVSARFNVTNYR